jgi:hypothetical protein
MHDATLNEYSFVGVSKNFGFIKHVAIAMTLGVGLGMVWKVGEKLEKLLPNPTCKHVFVCSKQSWHWNEKRYIAQYYADLAKKETREANERQAELQAKFKALEEELLS